MALTYANFCMILVGFNLLQPFQVCVTGSLFTVRRFGGDAEKTSLYVGRNVQANFLGVFFGGLFAVALLCIPVKYFEHYFSLISVWLTLAVNIALFFVYAFSKNKTNVKFYFWGFALAGLLVAFVQTSTTKVEGASVYFFGLGLGCTGFFVFSLQGILKFILKALNKNVDYWLITCHLAFNVLLSTASAVCWTVLVVPRIGDEVASSLTGDGPTLKEALLGASVHILFCFVSHFVVMTVFPMLVPYHLCSLESCHDILITCLCMEAAVAVAVGYLTDKYTGVPWVGDKAWWHLLWLIALPAFLLWVAFLYALHYPESKLKKKMKESGFVGGLIICIFYFCGQGAQNISMANCFANTFGAGATGNDGLAWCGHVISITVFVAIFGLVTGAFLGESHLRLYVEHEKEAMAPQDWPSYGYSTGKAILYWVCATFKKAAMSIPTLFALDVVALIQH